MSKKQGAKIVIVLTFISILTKGTGFIRDALIASKFGATLYTDIYIFSSDFTLLAFNVISTGLYTAFIPMLSDLKYDSDKKVISRFINNVMSIMIVVSILLCIVSAFFSEQFILTFASGFTSSESIFRLSIEVMRIMSLSVIFIAIQSVLTGILQFSGKFVVNSLVLIVSYIVLIIYLIGFADKFGLLGYAVVTIIGYALQALICYVSFKSLGIKYRFVIDLKDCNMRKMFILMIPTVISATLAQISILINRSFGSYVGEGVISALNFANKITNLPYTILVTSIITIIYPKLSKLVSKNDKEGFNKLLTSTMSIFFILILPISIFLVIMREPVISFIFKRGKFDDIALKNTAIALVCYSPTMLLYGFKDLYTRAFFAIKNTKTPMITSLLTVGLNIVIMLVFTRSYGIIALASANSVAALISVIILAVVIRNRYTKNDVSSSYLKRVAKILLANAIFAILTFLMKEALFVGEVNNIKNLQGITLISIVGVIVYFVLMFLFKIEEVMIYVNKFKNKFKCRQIG